MKLLDEEIREPEKEKITPEREKEGFAAAPNPKSAEIKPMNSYFY